MAPSLLSSALLLCSLAQQLHLGLSAEEEQILGNPKCWSGNFNFENCCASEAAGRDFGCWNIHFNYELCCLTPYRPNEQCQRSQTAGDLLWHCRVRPHREFDRCLGSDVASVAGAAGTVGWFQGQLTYEKYVQAQREKADRELNETFASTRALEVVSEYLRRHFRTRTRLRGVCHGAKVGREVRLLSQQLDQREKGVRTASFANDLWILGTDISEEAVRASKGQVLLMDFHMVYLDWKGSWDFVYSNTLDHSYEPGSALLSWRWTIKGADGLVVLHRSEFHTTMHIDASDLYGGSIGDYCSLLRKTGFQILDVVRLPRTASHHEEDLIFAARGTAADLFELQVLNEAPSGRLQ